MGLCFSKDRNISKSSNDEQKQANQAVNQNVTQLVDTHAQKSQIVQAQPEKKIHSNTNQKKKFDPSKFTIADAEKYAVQLFRQFDTYNAQLDVARNELKKFPPNVNKKNVHYKEACKNTIKWHKKIQSTRKKISMIQRQLEHLEVIESGQEFSQHVGGLNNELLKRKKQFEVGIEDIKVVGENAKEMDQLIQENEDAIGALEDDDEEDEMYEYLENIENEYQSVHTDPRKQPTNKPALVQNNGALTEKDRLLAAIMG